MIENIQNGSIINDFTIQRIYSVKAKKQNITYAECLCACGTITHKRLTEIRREVVKDCGCKFKARQKQKCIEHNTTHGMGDLKDRLYRIWCAMKSRCYTVNNLSYPNYGGRGIRVCEEWFNYANFKSWAEKHGYRSDLTIDRIDVDGNYYPENCRWCSRIDQANNKRSNHFITAFGDTKTLAQWELDERCNCNPAQISYRVKRGWTPENAISVPVMNTNRHLGKIYHAVS